MASPAWLSQEGQSSISPASVTNAPTGGSSAVASSIANQPPLPPLSSTYKSMGTSGTNSDSMQESGQAKFANGPTNSISPPLFSYNVHANISSASGSSERPASSPATRSNAPVSSTYPQPAVSAPTTSSNPSFSSNMPHAGGSFSNGQQFHSSMVKMIPADYSQGERNVLPSLASLQPPFPGQLARPIPLVPGTTANVILPLASSPAGVLHGISPGLSYGGNPQLPQKDQSSKSSVTADISQRSDSASSTSSISQHAHATSGSESLLSTTNPHPSNLWMPNTASFQVVPGVSARPPIPGPPGVNPALQLSSETVPSASVDPSLTQRPITGPAPFPANPGVQQQAHPFPLMSAPPHGPWIQPPYIGGTSRPQFVQYPASFSGHFSAPVRGASIAPTPFPDHQFPVGTPEQIPGELYTLSANSFCQSTTKPVMQSESLPGIDAPVNDVNLTVTEQLDAWTAHRTEAGVIYYYNAVTGESTYEKPSGFKGEADRVTTQPIPISMEKLEGTEWSLVTTNDGKKYYYNSITKLSSWQVPTEVTELKKKQDADSVREKSTPIHGSNVSTDKVSASVSLSAPAVITGGRDAVALRTSGLPGSSSALDLIKKKLQDSSAPATSSPVPIISGVMPSESNGSRAVEAIVKVAQGDNSKDKLKDADGDCNLSDSSLDSEGEDSGPTKEERIIQFREMLKERGVAPFSKWEKELPKIVFDPRFKAIPSHSGRRAIFEHYVRTRAEEERKEKRAAQKASVEGFKQLLDEVKEDINENTDYQTFKKKWGHDRRFTALDRKEREILLNERILPLKRASEERALALRLAVASNFKSMLQERGDITTSTRWSKIKDSLRDDPRYKSVKHEDRDALFNEYIAELKAAEEEAERVAKSKQDEEEKLKERERALRKRKEREEQEVERVRLKARRKEAVESYQALLVETIKDPQASWTESRSKLEKDPQARATNPYLDQSDLEKFFREHVKILQERCALEYRSLLAEVVTAEAAAQETEDGKTVLTSWSTAKRLLKSDPRYTKMPRKDRESFWRRHVEEIQQKQKSASNRELEKHRDVRSKSSMDSGKYFSESRRNQ